MKKSKSIKHKTCNGELEKVAVCMDPKENLYSCDKCGEVVRL